MNLVALTSGTLTSSEAEEMRREIRRAKADGTLNALVKTIARALEVERASSVADMDHFYCIGVLLRSVVGDDSAFLEAFKRLGIRQVPGGIAFRGGMDGLTFDETYANLLETKESIGQRTHKLDIT